MKWQMPVREKRCPTHPGELLKEDVLPALRLPVAEAARQLGVSRQTLYKIIAGTSPVTPEMAVRLGKWCGNGPGLWLRMQQAFDLWHAERRWEPRWRGLFRIGWSDWCFAPGISRGKVSSKMPN